MSNIICIENSSKDYPEKLNCSNDNAPKRLYCIGDLRLLEAPSVAVVGARKASEYGKWAAYNAGRILAEHGLVTVSGMAYGCDTKAHRGALENGGKTIAVLAGGPDVCYPKANRILYENIIKTGLVISENPPGTPPLRGLFPQRNRIISGISDMVVIAEAASKSGSLITARAALEQGKDVMVFPHNIINENGNGGNQLIFDGAAPVTAVEDIIRQLGIDVRQGTEQASERLTVEEIRILKLIKMNGEMRADEISRKSGLDIRHIHAVVSILEVRGLVKRAGDRIIIAK